jgi:hypothetical protein
MPYRDTVGVRLSAETGQKVLTYASVLRIPQSSFIRVLVNLALELVEKNPEILLDRNSNVGFSGK